MSLPPLSRIGPYEIISRLGAGAMGEVYRATDSRLGRDVAIKILPADVSNDPSRKARFEQEARAVAALNHPNILGLYDIGEEDGVSYLVTEFVTGETLAAILERGPLPVKKLLDIAVQIADGMAAAHTARITHRDLKPANIMVSAEGRVKILDFGLAKQAIVSTDPDETVLAGHTQPGMILGTVNYMSPEQARGVATDHRSDQFSFGLILYEMAAGKRAFERPESVQTMSAIIGENPPPIEQDLPAPLVWAIDRCLAKDPAERYESTRDLYQGLKSLRDHATESGSVQRPTAIVAPKPVRPPARTRVWPLMAAFGLGLVVALAIYLWRTDATMTNQSAYRFTPFSFWPGGQTGALWAPDGKSVAYAARGADGPYQVYIRYLDAATPVQITHATENAYPLAWAPDGKRLLLTIDRQPNALWSIATVGGEPEVVIPSMPASRLVAASPDNKAVAYFYPGDDGVYGVWIASPLDAKPVRYQPAPYATKDLYNQPKLRFSPDGRKILLLMNGGRSQEEAWLLPYPADPAHPPQRVVPNMVTAAGTPAFCWMPDSRQIVIALSAPGENREQLWLADTVTGKSHALTSGTTTRSSPSVSPDGKRLIFRENTGSWDVVAVDIATGTARPYLATERDESMPAWAAHKPLMAYVTNRNGPDEIWLHTLDNGDRPLVTARDFPGIVLQWLMGPALSPEGDRVVYSRIDLGGKNPRLWISAVAGGAPVPLTTGPVSAEYPGSWSLDGAWFTYVAIMDGDTNLMKVKASGQATPLTVKAHADYDNNAVPIFSPDGQWILLGETLYAADGSTSKPIGKHDGEGYVFSADGKLLYGVRKAGRAVEFFSVDLAGGAEKPIGKAGSEYVPGSNLNPAMRFTLTPDGKSIVYAAGRFQDNLWLLEGFAPR